MGIGVWLDMDGTIIDFACGDLERGLKLMHIPEYYRNLPLKQKDIKPLILEMKSMGVTVGIVSGIADKTVHGQYIRQTESEYMLYFQQVKRIKEQELEKHIGLDLLDYVFFHRAGVPKDQIVEVNVHPEDWSKQILVDDMPMYRSKWRLRGGQVVDATEDWRSNLEWTIKSMKEDEGYGVQRV